MSEVVIEIARCLWGKLVPTVKSIYNEKGLNKYQTGSVINMIFAFYVSVAGFLSKETREKVDKKVRELINEGRTSGKRDMQVWLLDVLYPVMQDEKFIDFITHYAETPDAGEI